MKIITYFLLFLTLSSIVHASEGPSGNCSTEEDVFTEENPEILFFNDTNNKIYIHEVKPGITGPVTSSDDLEPAFSFYNKYSQRKISIPFHPRICVVVPSDPRFFSLEKRRVIKYFDLPFMREPCNYKIIREDEDGWDNPKYRNPECINVKVTTEDGHSDTIHSFDMLIDAPTHSIIHNDSDCPLTIYELSGSFCDPTEEKIADKVEGEIISVPTTLESYSDTLLPLKCKRLTIIVHMSSGMIFESGGIPGPITKITATEFSVGSQIIKHPDYAV